MSQIRLNSNDVEIPENTTVGGLMQQEGLSIDQLEVLVNGQVADINRTLEPNDTVFTVSRDETEASPAGDTGPSAIGIRVGRFPGKPANIEVDSGTTIRQALEEAGLNPTGFEVRRNGQEVDLDQVVQEGDQVVLFRPVQGNQQEPTADNTVALFCCHVRQAV